MAGARLRGLGPGLAAACAGAAAALGQAPWGLWPLTIAGLALIAVVVARAPDGRAAFARGWWGAFGMFALAMSWIVEPFLIEPGRHGWMAPFALLILPGGLALFWGAAAALARGLAVTGPGRVWAFALSVTGAEALRGWLFGGFPWAMPGHVWIGTPLAQLAALTGPLGLSALTLALAAGLAGLAVGPRQAGAVRSAAPAWRPAPVALLLALAPLALAGAGWIWGGAQLARAMPEPAGPRLRLVQPNADQALKWDPDFAELYFFRHLDLTAAPAADGRPPDLILWSETAVPFSLESPGAGLEMAAEAAGGAPLVLGIQRGTRDAMGVQRYHNSLAVLDAEGGPTALYDKHHLVPFGEYVPYLSDYADRPGWEWLAGFASQALLGYTPGAGPAVLDLGPLGQVLPLICYEAIFPRHLRTAERPDWLLQLTNDAWFGAISGPYQHLAQTRLRAIEQGLPMVRVANTGVSAVIDARGRVLDSLPLDTDGILDADLPGALPPTLYARTGDLPWHLALVLGLGGLVLRRRPRAGAPAAD